MFGSHLSIAGSLANALREAESLGLDTVQVFTKNQRQWRTPPLAEAARDEWLAELSRLGWGSRTAAHNSYLANLASPDETLWSRSLDLMREEVSRADALSIRYLVFHPGAHLGSGVEAGCRRVARACAILLRESRGSAVRLCLENTAGGGTTLGRSFEELATIRRMIGEELGAEREKRTVKGENRGRAAAHGDDTGAALVSRVAFCIDTCHALAAGYDLAGFEPPEAKGMPAAARPDAAAEAAAIGVLDEFDRLCGLTNLAVLHLNDSKGSRGSRLDRHEHIGRGQVALAAFRVLVTHPRLRDVPKILETPKENDAGGVPMDTINLNVLRGLMGSKPGVHPPSRPRAGALASRQGTSRGSKRSRL